MSGATSELRLSDCQHNLWGVNIRETYEFNELHIVMNLDAALVTSLNPGSFGPSDFLHVVREEAINKNLILINPDRLGENVLDLAFPMLGSRLTCDIGEFDGSAPFTGVGLVVVGTGALGS